MCKVTYVVFDVKGPFSAAAVIRNAAPLNCIRFYKNYPLQEVNWDNIIIVQYICMDFTLLQNEDVALKHVCVFNKQEGCLYLTNIRLAWIPDRKDVETVVVPISDISKDQYSPANDPRIMLRITRISNNTPLVFILIGSDVLECRRDLENIKVCMKRFRSGSTTGSSNGELKQPSSGGISVNNVNGMNKTQRILHSNKLAMFRENLLLSNYELRQQYNELVKEAKVIDEEEFWESRKFLISDKEATDVASSKGALSSLLSDAQALDRDGKVLVQTITPEIIHHIFEMYPAVKSAFEATVPVEMTEIEFWTRYFQSEYFTRDKGIKSNHHENNTDDMFERYERQQGSTSSSGGGSLKYENRLSRSSQKSDNSSKKFVNTNGNNSNNLMNSTSNNQDSNENNEQLRKRKMSSQLLHKDVDISTIESDYHNSRVSFSMNSEQPDELPQATAVIQKYNRNSNLVMRKQYPDPPPTLTSSTVSNVNLKLKNPITTTTRVSAASAIGSSAFLRDDEDDFPELLANQPQRYIQLQLSTTNKILPDHHYKQQQQAESESFHMKTKALVSKLSVEDILSSLESCFPSSSRSRAFLSNLHRQLQDLSSGDTQREEDGAGASDSRKEAFLTMNEKILPDDFRQRMLERFSTVTELLRHFYAVLSRDGVHAPLPGSESAMKIQRILGKLEEQLEHLNAQRKAIQDRIRQDKVMSSVTSTNMLRLIKQVSDMIHRALDKWTQFNETIATGGNQQSLMSKGIGSAFSAR